MPLRSYMQDHLPTLVGTSEITEQILVRFRPALRHGVRTGHRARSSPGERVTGFRLPVASG